MLVQISTSHIPIERHKICVLVIHSFDHVEFVRYEIGVLSAPIEQFYLLHSYEPSKIVDLSFRVVSVGLESAKVKKFRSIVNLFPEALLHSFLSPSQILINLKVVQVG